MCSVKLVRYVSVLCEGISCMCEGSVCCVEVVCVGCEGSGGYVSLFSVANLMFDFFLHSLRGRQ